MLFRQLLTATAAVSILLAGGFQPASATSPTGTQAEVVIQTGASASAQAGRGYAFLNTDKQGRYARWNSCKPIRWAYNSKRQSRGTLADTKYAFQRIHQATGLKFKYVGRTTSVPFKGKVPGNIDVRVGWGTAASHPGLFGRGSRAAGYGGSKYQYYNTDSGTTSPEYVTGEYILRANTGYSHSFFRVIMMHELGHVVGLDHVRDRRSIMAPTLGFSRGAGLTQGDRRGFRKVGRGGCFSQPIR